MTAEEILELKINNKSDSFDRFYKADVIEAMQEYASIKAREAAEKALKALIQDIWEMRHSKSHPHDNAIHFSKLYIEKNYPTNHPIK